MRFLFIFLTAFLTSSFNSINTKHNVKVEITGVRSFEGKIIMGVYISSQRFEEKKDSRIITIEKSGLKNQKLNSSFYLEPGTYGLSILDDENNNTKMDFNFIGMPKEGFGFSNYYHSGFTYPKFQNFAFTIKPGEEKNVVIKLRYVY